VCELNVIEQVMNVCQATVVQDAWARGQDLAVHGLIYGIHDGRLRDLNVQVTQPREIALSYKSAILSVESAGGAVLPKSGDTNRY
jgi:carbonic anhydrase